MEIFDTIQGNSPTSAKDPPATLVSTPEYQREVRFEYN